MRCYPFCTYGWGLNLFSNAYSEAIAAYEIYSKLLPKDEYAINKPGIAYFESRNYTKAVELFQRAVAINPSFDKAQKNVDAAGKKL